MPQMGVMVGYAVTVVCEPSHPRHKDNQNGFLDYYRYVAAQPGPKIVVVHDLGATSRAPSARFGAR
jgi:hypothetical protein